MMKSATQMRILCLDTGSKKIGLAYWEPSSQWITPLPRLNRSVLKNEIEFIRRIIEKYQVEAFLVGLPYSLGEKRTQSTENALFWAQKLKDEFNLPVFTYDESMSTTEAYSRLAHKKSKDREAQKDSVAAAIILEEFMRDRKMQEGMTR